MWKASPGVTLADAPADALLRQLEHPCQEVRERAARELAARALVTSSPELLPELCGILPRLPAPGQVALLGVFRILGDARCVDAVQRLADRVNGVVLAEAVRTLREIGGEAARDALLALLRSGQPNRVGAAALALGELKAVESVPELCRVLATPPGLFSPPEALTLCRVALVETLGRLRDPTALPTLRLVQRRYDFPAIQVACTRALVRCGEVTPESLRALSRVTTPEEAWQCLWDVDPCVYSCLVQLLGEGRTQAWAAAVLLRFRLEAFHAVAGAVREGPLPLRLAALGVLVQLPNPRVPEVLLETCRSGEPELQRQSLLAVGESRRGYAVTALRALWPELPAESRGCAAIALVELGDPKPELVPHLVEALVGSEPRVAARAASCLAQLAGWGGAAAFLPAIPYLQRWTRFTGWMGRSDEGAFTRALSAIQKATQGTRSLPLPAARVATRAEDLPLPSENPDPGGAP